MDTPTSEVGYTLATTRRGDHEVYMDVVALGEKPIYTLSEYFNCNKN
jgi:hypothetical protein